MEIFCEIERARQRLGVSPAALCKAARVHHSTYSQLAQGRKLTPAVSEKLLDALMDLEARNIQLRDRIRRIGEHSEVA